MARTCSKSHSSPPYYMAWSITVNFVNQSSSSWYRGDPLYHPMVLVSVWRSLVPSGMQRHIDRCCQHSLTSHRCICSWWCSTTACMPGVTWLIPPVVWNTHGVGLVICVRVDPPRHRHPCLLHLQTHFHQEVLHPLHHWGFPLAVLAFSPIDHCVGAHCDIMGYNSICHHHCHLLQDHLGSTGLVFVLCG